MLSCAGRYDTGDYIPYRIPSVYLYYSGLYPAVTTPDPRSECRRVYCLINYFRLPPSSELSDQGSVRSSNIWFNAYRAPRVNRSILSYIIPEQKSRSCLVRSVAWWLGVFRAGPPKKKGKIFLDNIFYFI